MLKNIVSRETIKKVLGRIMEAGRMLLDDGLEFSDFQVVINDPDRRNRLVNYWRAGMPEVEFWKVWKTIKRDPSLRTSEDSLVALTENGFKVSYWAKDIMSKDDFKNSLEGNSEQEYDLFLLTTSQLIGKAKNGTTQEIFAGAERLGFQKCPAWIGSQFRLNYKNQPNDEWIRIGMDPITDSVGAPRVFSVHCFASELCLYALYASSGLVWRSDNLWLVCRSRK